MECYKVLSGIIGMCVLQQWSVHATRGSITLFCSTRAILEQLSNNLSERDLARLRQVNRL